MSSNMIVFLGDIVLSSGDITSEYKINGSYVFNLEYVVGTKGKPVGGKINLRAGYGYFDKLFGAMPIAVDVANNHALDFGEEGLNSSLNFCRENDIGVAGVERYIYNKETGLLAYTMFYGEYNNKDYFSFSKERFLKDVAVLKQQRVRNIVVIMHWGIENHPYASKKQVELAHWMIDNSADLIIGQHPHCLQPVEEYKGKYIFYSLGNCIFPYLNIDSYYDEKGIPLRKYRIKPLSWNKESYAIYYDEKIGEVDHVDCLYFTNGVLKRLKTVSFAELKKGKVQGGNLRFTLRKYASFLVSNSCVDGKLFDLNAIKHELMRK